MNPNKLIPIFTFWVGIKGESKTHWTEQHSSGHGESHNTTRTVDYNGERDIVNDWQPAFRTGEQLLPNQRQEF